jgi:HicB-like protein involved in pilus formation
MPQALHAELTRSAEREAVSLNQFITSALARTVGWSSEVESSRTASDELSRQAATRHARLVVIALFANVAVIGLTALAAIVLLVLAWRG